MKLVLILMWLLAGISQSYALNPIKTEVHYAYAELEDNSPFLPLGTRGSGVFADRWTARAAIPGAEVRQTLLPMNEAVADRLVALKSEADPQGKPTVAAWVCSGKVTVSGGQLLVYSLADCVRK